MTKIKFEIDVEATRSAALNCDNLDNIALKVKSVNPKSLTLDDQVWGFESLPVNDKIKVPTPNTLRYVAIRSINVESLAKNVKEGYITVNGDVDIPMESGEILSLDKIFIPDEMAARLLAKTLTENQLDLAIKMEKDAKEGVRFLQEQIDNDRF